MSEELCTFILITVLFHLKHFLCDFLFQTSSMVVKKGSPKWDFALPLAQHSGIHGLFTLVIVLYFDPGLWWLGPLDLVVHFVIDRLKSGPKFLGRYSDPSTAVFWNILGLDQTLHHLFHVYIAYLLVI